MSSMQKFEGIVYFLLGLFMLVVIGGKLLIQLLGVICGFMLCYRGWKLLYPQHAHRSMFTFFQQNRFF